MNTVSYIIVVFLILITVGYILVNLSKVILASFVIYLIVHFFIVVDPTVQVQQTSKDDVLPASLEEIVYRECLELTERPDLCKEIISQNI